MRQPGDIGSVVSLGRLDQGGRFKQREGRMTNFAARL
jgi:hypothetical protein